MATQTIGQQAIDLFRKYGTKSNVARELLDRGYSVSEISKAVPMAYSQVFSIAKARAHDAEPQRASTARPAASRQAAPASTSAPAQASGRQERHPPRAAYRPQGKVGKLRTPGQLGSDKAVGECANCGHDLVVRQGPQQLMLVHVNTTADEYLETIQFCMALPACLLK